MTMPKTMPVQNLLRYISFKSRQPDKLIIAQFQVNDQNLHIAEDLATADTIDYCVSLIQNSESECLTVDPISKERNTINNVRNQVEG